MLGTSLNSTPTYPECSTAIQIHDFERLRRDSVRPDRPTTIFLMVAKVLPLALERYKISGLQLKDV
jgi:hypothetical protein